MHITVLAVGTRGDVQPSLALAIGLRAAGHQVRFATESSYAAAAIGAGLEYFPLSGNSERIFSGRVGLRFRELLEDPQSSQMRQRYQDSFAGSMWMQHTRRQLAECFAASEATDVFIAPSWLGIASSIAEKRGIPVIVAAAFPVPDFPTTAFPSPWQKTQSQDMSAAENLRTWDEWPRLWEQSSYVFIQEWREQVLGLPRQSLEQNLAAARRLPHVLGYSPYVLPKPQDWDEHTHVTGFWFLSSAHAYQAPDELRRFLDAGDPPVVVGFGSLVGRHPSRLTRVVVDALQGVGRRGLLIRGWGGLRSEALPDTMLSMPSVPYDWLLPRSAGVVHHGGVGTMAVALQAGVPQAVVAFGLDQAFWGYRTAALGVGPPPMTATSLTQEQLMSALETMAMDATKQRARVASEVIRGERGVEQAVEVIEQITAVAA